MRKSEKVGTKYDSTVDKELDNNQQSFRFMAEKRSYGVPESANLTEQVQAILDRCYLVDSNNSRANDLACSAPQLHGFPHHDPQSSW